MAVSQGDLDMIRVLGISQQDFEKMSVKEQNAILAKAIKLYIKNRELQGKPENYANATNFVPKVKELLQSPPRVYYKKLSTTNGKETISFPEVMIIGYSASENKYLTITANPKGEGNPNIIKVLEGDIIFKAEDMKI